MGTAVNVDDGCVTHLVNKGKLGCFYFGQKFLEQLLVISFVSGYNQVYFILSWSIVINDFNDFREVFECAKENNKKPTQK